MKNFTGESIELTNEEAALLIDPKTSRLAFLNLSYNPELQRVAGDEACRIAAWVLREHSAALDRSRWDGCDCCTIGDGEFRRLLDKWGYEDFCPQCGRPLTEQAWAELERRLS